MSLLFSCPKQFLKSSCQLVCQSVGRFGGVCEKVTYNCLHTYLPIYLPNNSDNSDSSNTNDSCTSCDSCDSCDSSDSSDSSGDSSGNSDIRAVETVVSSHTVFFVNNQKEITNFFL